MESVRQIYAELDEAWDREIQKYEGLFPCGPGCADCCKARVENVPLPVGRLEADALWEEMASLPESVQEKIVTRLLVGDPSTCVFLSPDDLCLVYEGRPFFCRIFGLSCDATCGKIPTIGGPRWIEAVNETHAELRMEDDSLVSVRRLVERLGG